MARIIFLKKDVTGLLPDNFIQDEILVTVTGSNRLVIPECVIDVNVIKSRETPAFYAVNTYD